MSKRKTKHRHGWFQKPRYSVLKDLLVARDWDRFYERSRKITEDFRKFVEDLRAQRKS